MWANVDWAEWIPALVAIAAIVFNAGVTYASVMAQNKRLDAHRADINADRALLTAQGLEIVAVKTEVSSHGQRITRLEDWRDGYNAAVATHNSVQSQ
jgi:hypothetical protein